jgi:hypothetical protein
VPHFTFHFHNLFREHNHEHSQTHSAVEDDPKDIELTINALGEYNLANEIAIARDGVEALDYSCPEKFFPLAKTPCHCEPLFGEAVSR